MQSTEGNQGEPVTAVPAEQPPAYTPTAPPQYDQPVKYDEPIQHDEPIQYNEPVEDVVVEVQPTGVLGRTITAYNTESVCSALVGGIMAASCIELAQAGEECRKWYNECEEEFGYAVCVGTISLFLCLIYFLIYMNSRGNVGLFNKYVPFFFFLWWGIGTIVMTFDRPFSNTGNGYFACWGATIMSLVYCQITMAKFKILGEKISAAITGSQERKLLMLIMILSFVVAYAAIVLWDERNMSYEKQTDQETWAFAAGMVSGGIIAVYMLLEMCKPGMLGPKFIKNLSWFLVPWWVFGAGVATFDEPFPSTGNGYFCAWGTFISSCYLAYCTTLTVPA